MLPVTNVVARSPRTPRRGSDTESERVKESKATSWA
jgi:hypothetical protein